MAENETILYRGATYEIGRGPGYYGIWPAEAPRPASIEWWPETPDGWQGAWARFTALETPGTIVPVNPPAAGPAAGPRPIPGQAGPTVAAGLLAAGVAFGIGGLFPAYLGGASLAQLASQLLPHVIYLAVWTASAVLVLRGGARLKAGALLGLGASIVTFGFFFSDAGQVIAGGSHLMGLGLVLSLIGWVVATAGAVMAFRVQPAGAPVRPRSPDRRTSVTVAWATLAAVGTAAAFAPSWDSYTLRTPAGVTETLTAGNAFASPAAVIPGNVAVMAGLVVVAVAAALWRPRRLGVALLAGAAIPMVAQAVAALAQLGEPVSPAQFGISPAQAAQAGLTISSGLTAAFWIYCAFVVALLAAGAWMLVPRRPAAVNMVPPVQGQPVVS